jgi:hypothetical protein
MTDVRIESGIANYRAAEASGDAVRSLCRQRQCAIMHTVFPRRPGAPPCLVVRLGARCGEFSPSRLEGVAGGFECPGGTAAVLTGLDARI